MRVEQPSSTLRKRLNPRLSKGLIHVRHRADRHQWSVSKALYLVPFCNGSDLYLSEGWINPQVRVDQRGGEDQKRIFPLKKGACGNVPGPKTCLFHKKRRLRQRTRTKNIFSTKKKAPAAALLDPKNIFLRKKHFFADRSVYIAPLFQHFGQTS